MSFERAMNEAEVRKIAAQEAAHTVQAFYRVFANQLGGDVEAAGKATEPAETAETTKYLTQIHRNDAWRGRGGFVWYCDSKSDGWYSFAENDPRPIYLSPRTDTSAYGPFTKVVPAEVSVTPTVLTPSVGLDPDVALLMRNAADGIDSWLNGGLCRDVTYWESVRLRLHAEARRQTVQTSDRINGDIDTLGARLESEPPAGRTVFAVMDVLAEHLPRPTRYGNGIYCEDENGLAHLICVDWEQWIGHVAPLIAAACTPQPAGISAAGEMFPQSQKQQK